MISWKAACDAALSALLALACVLLLCHIARTPARPLPAATLANGHTARDAMDERVVVIEFTGFESPLRMTISAETLDEIRRDYALGSVRLVIKRP
jgi:hypothetical protein